MRKQKNRRRERKKGGKVERSLPATLYFRNPSGGKKARQRECLIFFTLSFFLGGVEGKEKRKKEGKKGKSHHLSVPFSKRGKKELITPLTSYNTQRQEGVKKKGHPL